MGEVSRLSDAHTWSISQIAKAFKMDRRTVSTRLQEAGIRPAGTRNGYPIYALSDIRDIVGTIGSGANFGALSPDNMMPKDRKDWYQSENERLKFEESMSNLIQAHDAHREMSSLCKMMAQTLTSIPDLLERKAGITGKAIDMVEELLDGAREQLYQHIQEQEEGDLEEV